MLSGRPSRPDEGMPYSSGFMVQSRSLRDRSLEFRLSLVLALVVVCVVCIVIVVLKVVILVVPSGNV